MLINNDIRHCEPLLKEGRSNPEINSRVLSNEIASYLYYNTYMTPFFKYMPGLLRLALCKARNDDVYFI